MDAVFTEMNYKRHQLDIYLVSQNSEAAMLKEGRPCF